MAFCQVTIFPRPFLILLLLPHISICPRPRCVPLCLVNYSHLPSFPGFHLFMILIVYYLWIPQTFPLTLLIVPYQRSLMALWSLIVIMMMMTLNGPKPWCPWSASSGLLALATNYRASRTSRSLSWSLTLPCLRGGEP